MCTNILEVILLYQCTGARQRFREIVSAVYDPGEDLLTTYHSNLSCV